MLHANAIASLRAWEAAFPVARWTIDGLHVWPLIRVRLAQHLLAAGRPARARPGMAEGAGRLLALAADRLRPVSTIRRIPRADVVILTRPANRQQLQGRWVDRLFDPLTDAIEAGGWSALHLEHRGDGTLYRTPRHRPAVVTRPALTRRNVLAALRSIRGARLDGYAGLARAVALAHPDVSAPSPLWIARRARSVEGAAAYFEGVLRRAAPRVALCSVYYTLAGMAFCLAARRAGIPPVDVQHGVTAGNPAYEGWSAFPSGGYALMPAWFWCWSASDASPLEMWPEAVHRYHRPIVGGHPWMAYWTSGHPLVAVARERLPARARGGLTVLVTLTWSSGLSDVLQRVLHEAPPAWIFWVRLHPLMDRERAIVRGWCDRHAAGRAFVDAPSDLPLPLLLAHADAHLTHNSTVVQEAARAGLPSVVVDAHALDVYPELRSGWALFAADSREAIAALESQRDAAASLPRLAPYPSWPDVAAAVRRLMTLSPPCPATAGTASSPTRARA